MDKFLEAMTKGYFWIAVVAVGIAINIASSALIKLGGTAIKYVPSWLRSISDARTAQHEAAVVEFLARPELREMYVAAEIRARLRCVTYISCAFFLFFAAQWLIDSRRGLSPYISLPLLMVSAFGWLKAVNRLNDAVRSHNILVAGFRALKAAPPMPSTQVIGARSINP